MNRTPFGPTNNINKPMMPLRAPLPPRIGLPQQRFGSVIPRPGPAMRQPMGGLQAFGMADGGDVGQRWLDEINQQQTFAPTDSISRNARLRRHGMTMDEASEGRFKGYEPMSGRTIVPRDPEAFYRARSEIETLARAIARRRGLRFASGGYASGGHPDMSWLTIRDALRTMPNRAVPDYLLAGFAEGGNIDEILRAHRRRHGVGGGFSGLDRDAPMRTMLHNDPISHWDSEIPRQYDLWKWRRPRRGVEMDPDFANEITQNAIDTVHGPGLPRRIVEGLLGDSPGSVALGFPGKGWLPSPRMSGIGSMLYSGDAGAASDEMLPRDYEGYDRWQPFRRVTEAVR